GHSVADYVRCIEVLRDAPGLVAIELNLSCPNLEDRGIMFALSAERTGGVVAAARAAADAPVLAKLRPDAPDVGANAERAAGARGIADFCESRGITSLDEIRGQVKEEG